MGSIQGGGETATDAAYGSVSVDATADLVKASNKDRISLTMRNEGASNVRIGDDTSVKYDDDDSADEGLLLESGETLTLSGHKGDVYAICKTGESAVVSFFEESE